MEELPGVHTMGSRMRVLLQNTETKLYFAGPNEWTEDSSKAVDFEHVDRASEAYNTQNLNYAQIVLEPRDRRAQAEYSSGGERAA